MIGTRARLAAAAALMGLAYAPHAMATVGTATYFGVVANTQTSFGPTEPSPDYDVADLFGGGNLEGDFVTASFTYNTYYGAESTDGVTFDTQDGGVVFGTSSPVTSATFTVQNPVTLAIYSYTFSPDAYAVASTGVAGVQDTALDTAGDQLSATIIPKLSAPINLSGSFASSGQGVASSFLSAPASSGLSDDIVFDTLEVSVSAAPEPATWTLMGVAVAIIGFAFRLRYRRNPSGAAILSVQA